jgi:hypothetical protein
MKCLEVGTEKLVGTEVIEQSRGRSYEVYSSALEFRLLIFKITE